MGSGYLNVTLELLIFKLYGLSLKIAPVEEVGEAGGLLRAQYAHRRDVEKEVGDGGRRRQVLPRELAHTRGDALQHPQRRQVDVCQAHVAAAQDG